MTNVDLVAAQGTLEWLLIPLLIVVDKCRALSASANP